MVFRSFESCMVLATFRPFSIDGGKTGVVCPIEKFLAVFRVNSMSADKIKDFQEQAQETAQTLKERAMEWQRTATDGVVTFAKSTDTYVHENPWPAIGMTALFAFAVGLLMGSRRS